MTHKRSGIPLREDRAHFLVESIVCCNFASDGVTVALLLSTGLFPTLSEAALTFCDGENFGDTASREAGCGLRGSGGGAPGGGNF